MWNGIVARTAPVIVWAESVISARALMSVVLMRNDRLFSPSASDRTLDPSAKVTFVAPVAPCTTRAPGRIRAVPSCSG